MFSLWESRTLCRLTSCRRVLSLLCSSSSLVCSMCVGFPFSDSGWGDCDLGAVLPRLLLCSSCRHVKDHRMHKQFIINIYINYLCHSLSYPDVDGSQGLWYVEIQELKTDSVFYFYFFVLFFLFGTFWLLYFVKLNRASIWTSSRSLIVPFYYYCVQWI